MCDVGELARKLLRLRAGELEWPTRRVDDDGVAALAHAPRLHAAEQEVGRLYGARRVGNGEAGCIDRHGALECRDQPVAGRRHVDGHSMEQVFVEKDFDAGLCCPATAAVRVFLMWEQQCGLGCVCRFSCINALFILFIFIKYC